MNAKKWAFYIFCFCLAGTIINSSGLYSVIETPSVNVPEANLGEGITDISEGITSAEDSNSMYDSGEMLSNILNTVKTFFSVLFIPGPYLVTLGWPSSVAGAIQAIANLTEAWAFMQLISGRQTKSMD